MNCTEHREWLNAWLDGTAPVEQAPAEQHRTGCAACRALFVAAQRMLVVLGRLTPPAPPAGLADDVVAGVRADRRRVLRIRRTVATVTALAAALLLAVYFTRPPTPAETIAGTNGPAAFSVDLASLNAGPSLEESLQEGTAALLALTRRTTSETVGQTQMLLPALVPDVPLPDNLVVAALTPPAQSLREVQESVSEGLEPVTTSWRRAVDLFRRNLPPMVGSE